jgi:hypothetical protein
LELSDVSRQVVYILNQQNIEQFLSMLKIAGAAKRCCYNTPNIPVDAKSVSFDRISRDHACSTILDGGQTRVGTEPVRRQDANPGASIVARDAFFLRAADFSAWARGTRVLRRVRYFC